jgi:hypothetical protein
MKKGLLFAIGVFMPLFAFCQHWEVGIMAGGANYSGDLTPGPIVLARTGFAGGGLVRYNISNYWTLKLNAYDGEISGSDADATTEQNKLRNLNFRSNVLDIGLQGELNILGFQSGTGKLRTSPYIFGGFSVFKFDPQAYYGGQWVRLQPLGTEGQGTIKYNDRQKYALTQVSIPFGIGLKHNFSGWWNIGFEFGWRKTFTDYLDDVSTTYVLSDYLAAQNGQLAANLSNRSTDPKANTFDDKVQRGNSTNKDWYMFGGLTLTYTIHPNMCYRF